MLGQKLFKFSIQMKIIKLKFITDSIFTFYKYSILLLHKIFWLVFSDVSSWFLLMFLYKRQLFLADKALQRMNHNSDSEISLSIHVTEISSATAMTKRIQTPIT